MKPANGFDKRPKDINRNGRPLKGYSITEWFQNMLASKPEVKDAIGNSIMEKALAGDPTAQKLVWNYMDGMPKQSDEDPGTKDNPLQMDINIKMI